MDRAIKKMLKKLESESAKERYEAVLALGKTGDIELIDALDKVANLDDHPKVRDLASKAVRTLEILRQRQIERERKERQIAEDDDGTIEWPELSKERMMREREVSIADNQEEWNYIEAKKKVLLSEEEARRRKEEAAKALKEQRAAELRRRRRPFRIFLWVAVTLALIGLALVGWYMVNVDPPPKTRAETIADLGTWKDDQQAALTQYQTELQKDPLDCKALRGITAPDRPRWTELVASSEAGDPTKRSGLSGLADDMSKIDASLVEGLDPLLSNLIRADVRLDQIRASIETACQGRDTLLQVEWAEYPQIGGLLAQVQNSLEDAVRQLAQVKPPANRLEVLVSLQEWATAQRSLVTNYQPILGSDPVNCDALRGLTAPPKPNWLQTLSSSDPLLSDLDAIISALSEADSKLVTIRQDVQATCQSSAVIAQAQWAGYLTAVDNFNQVAQLTDSSLGVLEQGISQELRQ